MYAARVLVGRKQIIAEIPVKGFFRLDGDLLIRNKFTRNMGSIIDGLLRLVNVSVFDENSVSRTAQTSTGGLLQSTTASGEQGSVVFAQFGTGTTPPTILFNNLANPSIILPTSYIDVIEDTSSTNLLIAARYSPPSLINATEMGLKLFVDTSGNFATLLARTVFPSAVSRSAYMSYFDGYQLTFPAEFTRWFVRALFCAMVGHRRRPVPCLNAKMPDGSDYSIQSANVFAGSPDVVIGSDNTPASPTFANLRSPIASLGSQTHAVEFDTTLDEVRIVRTGIYTPSTTTQLGEIGLFANINGFVGATVAARRTLLVRVALPTPVTLNAGTTYTLGIVLKLA
jgi:hypothetical protein